MKRHTSSKLFRYLIPVLMLFLFPIVASQCLAESDSEEILAVYKDGTVTREDLRAYAYATFRKIESLGADLTVENLFPDGERRKNAIRMLALEKILAEVARENNISIAEQHEESYQRARGRILSRIYYERAVVPRIKEAERKHLAACRKYYEEHEDQFRDPTLYSFRHIFVGDREPQQDKFPEYKSRCEEIHARLLKGESFAELAKQVSDGPVESAGELLGPVNPNTFSEEVQQALKSLNPGQFSLPFKTKYGYQIIFLESKDVGALMPFDEALPLIRQRNKVPLFSESLIAQNHQKELVEKYPYNVYSERFSMDPQKGEVVIADSPDIVILNRDVFVGAAIELLEGAENDEIEKHGRATINLIYLRRLAEHRASLEGMDRDPLYKVAFQALDRHYRVGTLVEKIKGGEKFSAALPEYGDDFDDEVLALNDFSLVEDSVEQ